MIASYLIFVALSAITFYAVPVAPFVPILPSWKRLTMKLDIYPSSTKVQFKSTIRSFASGALSVLSIIGASSVSTAREWAPIERDWAPDASR